MGKVLDLTGRRQKPYLISLILFYLSSYSNKKTAADLLLIIVYFFKLFRLITADFRKLLRRNPPEVRVTSGQKSSTKIICIVLQTSV